MKEQWKEVPGWRDYEVSTFGRVRSKERVVTHVRKGEVKRMKVPGMLLSTARKSTPGPRPSYPVATLCRSKGNRVERRQFCVHSLVLLTFVGPRPKGKVCRHFPDRNPNNNRLENLSYDTYSQNQIDRVAHGTDSRGERHSGAKVSEEQVREIRKRYKPGRWKPGKLTRKQLASEYKVKRVTIDKILSGEHWKHVCP
jgi:hypothetical protein